MGFCDTPILGRVCNIPDAVKSVWSWRFESVGAAGCSAPDETCLVNGFPEYNTPVGPNPAFGYDVSDPNRPEVTYQIYGIKNCDGSTKGITVEGNFGPDGTETASLETAPDGTITATITHKFNLQVGYPIKLTITGANGKSVEVLVSPPGWAEPPFDVCDTYPSPKVPAGYTVQTDPAEALPGDRISLFFPADKVIRCDNLTGSDTNNSLQVYFFINNQEIIAVSGNDNYSAEINTEGWDPNYYPIGMKIVDTRTNAYTIPESAASGILLKNPSGGGMPAVTISSNLTYAYHEGDIETNIECYSDDPNATFNWTVLRPDGLTNNYSIPQIASYLFDELGDYDFKCTVTGGDGITENYEIRSVSVYPNGTPIPILSILAPTSAPVGNSVNFLVGVPDTNTFTYEFNFADGTGWIPGTNINHPYFQTGVYGVVLRANLIADPSVGFTLNSPHNITIY